MKPQFGLTVSFLAGALVALTVACNAVPNTRVPNTPTASPTGKAPTGAPTAAPTGGPTATPTTAATPTVAPTAAPTASPTAVATASPTASPTPVATATVPTGGSPSPLPTLSGTRVDRMGLPAINTVFLGFNGFTKTLAGNTQEKGDAAQDTYNDGAPGTDAASYSAAFSDALQKIFGRTKEAADSVANTVLPDVLTLDTTKASGFLLNGRKLADDVIDAELQLLTGLSGATDKIAKNDKEFLTTFPYLAAPF